jgi:hypothetical protein
LWNLSLSRFGIQAEVGWHNLVQGLRMKMDQKNFEEVRQENEAQMARIREPLLISKSYPDPYWYCNACLHITGQNWDTYALGYKTAGDILAQYVIENNQHADFLVYPIGFLYRQYLELRLKELVVMGSRLLDREVDIPKHHRLSNLWIAARHHIEEVYPNSSSNSRYLEVIGERIGELGHLDPASDAFRYPEDKHGSPTLCEAEHINLKQLKDVIQGISVVLDGNSMAMWESLEAKHDMMVENAEYANEMHREMMAEYKEEMGNRHSEY